MDAIDGLFCAFGVVSLIMLVVVGVSYIVARVKGREDEFWKEFSSDVEMDGDS